MSKGWKFEISITFRCENSILISITSSEGASCNCPEFNSGCMKKIPGEFRIPDFGFQISNLISITSSEGASCNSPEFNSGCMKKIPGEFQIWDFRFPI